MNKIQITAISAVFLPALLLTGCALFLIGTGVAVGVGTVAYVNGELRAADEIAYSRAWDATLAAMDELQFRVTRHDRDALSGVIIARRSNDSRIEIRLKKQSDTVTQFYIRVDTFGDEILSRTIHDTIKKHY